MRVPTGVVAGGRDEGESAPGGEGAGGVGLAVAAHCSSSVATAIRVLEDYTEELAPGDRVVLTGASSAVAQVMCRVCLLVFLAASGCVALSLGSFGHSEQTSSEQETFR